MQIQKQAALAVLGVMLVLLALNPASVTIAAGFVASVVLVGFLEFLERNRQDAIQEHKDHVEKQIQELKNRIDGLTLSRGMGR